MSRLLQDLRFAFRVVIRNRFVSALAIVAFALGIGVTTAVFSIFQAVILTPLPFPESEKLVLVYDTQPACTGCPTSLPKYHDWKQRNQVFAAIGGAAPVQYTLTGEGDPERVPSSRVTATMGEVLGVAPAAGRWFTAQEDDPAGPKVAILSHAFWRTRFGADPQILGRKLTLSGVPHEVIGVMPPSFTFRGSSIYVPIAQASTPNLRNNHFMLTYARLKPAVSVERAQAEMRELGHTLASEFGNNHGVDVQPLMEAQIGSVRQPLQILLGAVFCVLIIACANVSNLLLASGLARRRELALRLALGANPRDLARQLTAESVVLAAIGGGIGLILAQWAVKTFVFLAGSQLPRGGTATVDLQVVGFAFALSLACGVFCGLWPMFRLKVRELAQTVRETDTRTASGGSRFGNGLVVAEIAVAFALLVGAALLVKNFILLQQRDTGLSVEGVITFAVAPTGPRYAQPAQFQEFYRQLQSRLSAIGGVTQVGFTSHLPMQSFGTNGEVNIEGNLPWDPKNAPLVEYRWYTGDFFKAFDIPLVRGRWLDQRDGANARTVLINQAMAEKFWPGQDPIGKRFGQGTDRTTWWEVAGVIGNIRSAGLTGSTMPYEFYRPTDQAPLRLLSGVVRTSLSDPSRIVPSIRQALRDIDPLIAVTQVQTMEQVVAASVGQPRLMSALSGLFGALAGLLAMVGIYGVMAFNVRRQRREFGIRLALGAEASRVRRMVIGRGAALAAIGVAIGAFGAWLLTGFLKSMLHDVSPNDPSVFAATAVGVLVVALLASWLPARTASRVDPMVVLRDS